MGKKIKVVGFDPSQSSWGVCQATVDVDDLSFTVDNLILIETKSEAKLGIRKDSDNLRRARELKNEVIKSCGDAKVIFSELPFMNAGGYAAANFNAGLVTGVLASADLPIVQVFPQEVKLNFCGSRHADKVEMVDKAVEMYPRANWIRRKLKGKESLTKKNEHLADAVAVIYTGIKSQQFKEMVAFFKSV